MKSESDRPVSLEDLLRLKRAERPPAEFWQTFDRELRAKQLSALVEKRPWWQTMPQAFPRLFRYRIALGASAIAVLTLVSLRTGDSAAPVAVAEIPIIVETPALADLPRAFAIVASAAANDTSSVAEATSSRAAETTVEAVTTLTAAEVPLVARATVSPTDGAKMESSAATSSPSAMVIAANLAGIRGTETEVSRSLLVKNDDFDARPASARVAIEPLQQMTPPSDSRRSRLLTAMVSTASSESSYRTSERAASRIDEERLYDQINRFGARGDRMNWKF